MKKLISAITSTALILTAVSMGSVSAATAPEEKDYKIIDSIEIPANQIKVFSFNYNNDFNCGVGFKEAGKEADDYATGNTAFFKNSTFTQPQTISLTPDTEYTRWFIGTGDVSDKNQLYSYDKTGGTYEHIRMKATDIQNFPKNLGFTEGTKFTFINKEYDLAKPVKENDIYRVANLSIISGAAVTGFIPDKNGYIDFYISTKLGDETHLVGEYRNESEWLTPKADILRGLSIGDVNSNGRINIDDATALQSYIAELSELDSLSKRAADVDRDGKIEVNDVTMLQKYLAGYNI